VNLLSLTVRPDVVLPTGLHGRTITANAAALAVTTVAGAGRVYTVQTERSTRYYLPHAVESFEAELPGQPRAAKDCAICGEKHHGAGETCSRSCRAKLRERRRKAK